MKIIRVFPRKTKATPDDENVRINCPPGLFDEADEIHISVAFTWDLPRAEWLEKQWRHVAPTKIGGPALNEQGGDFIPGKYLKEGYVITSRGCPNNCWFCSVPKREGRTIRELPIVEGCNILDDNILACSDNHIKSVFAMLSNQKNVEFTGGLEAAKLKSWHVECLRKIRPKQIFFAYDTPDDYEPLLDAGKLLSGYGFKLYHQNHALRAYVLCGYPKDTFDLAEKRMFDTIKAGFMPMAMLWRNDTGERNLDWSKFQRQWARPAIIASNMVGE
jgi:hypothetical protein